MTKLFISHSTKDTEFVRQLAQALTEMGMNVWIDITDIPAGMNWSTAVQKALDECEAMLVVISPEAMDPPTLRMSGNIISMKVNPLFPCAGSPPKSIFNCDVFSMSISTNGNSARHSISCAQIAAAGNCDWRFSRADAHL